MAKSGDIYVNVDQHWSLIFVAKEATNGQNNSLIDGEIHHEHDNLSRFRDAPRQILLIQFTGAQLKSKSYQTVSNFIAK